MSYQSHADLGGQAGHGRVEPEPEGKSFGADWERQALALTLAMGATGEWNLDMTRRARETVADYDSLSYYQLWIRGLEKLLIERGLVGADEIAAGRSLHPPRPLPRVLRAGEVPERLSRGSPTERPAAVPAKFVVGDRVRTRSGQVTHHTRLPAYARGKLGRIEHVHGMHVFPDANAHGLGEQPQWLYTVVFGGRELWGDVAKADLSVSIDAWEPYLEAAR